MVEQNPVARIHHIALKVVYSYPVGIQLLLRRSLIGRHLRLLSQLTHQLNGAVLGPGVIRMHPPRPGPPSGGVCRPIGAPIRNQMGHRMAAPGDQVVGGRPFARVNTDEDGNGMSHERHRNPGQRARARSTSSAIWLGSAGGRVPELTAR